MRGLSKEVLKASYFIGKIVDADDPDKEGKARIRVFGLFDDLEDDKLPWYQPFNRQMFSGDGGFADISVPKKDVFVQVRFSEGNIYSGEYASIQNFSEAVKKDISDTYLNSHVLAYDTEEELKVYYTPGKGLVITLKSSLINIAPDSSIVIEHKDSKSSIYLVGDEIQISSENTVNVSTKNVVIDHSETVELGAGASERLVLGDSFKSYFNSHVHIGNLGAPTTPPTMPMLDTLLSGMAPGAFPVVKTV